MRRSRLRTNPDLVRAWQRRSADAAVERAREASSRGSTRPRPSNSSDRQETPQEGPLSARAWRAAVWQLDDGACVSCGKSVPLGGSLWVWQAHHPIDKEELRARGLHHLVWDPRNGVVTCAHCHRQHTAALPRISGRRLPARTWEFARELGDWALVYLQRYHPSEVSHG